MATATRVVGILSIGDADVSPRLQPFRSDNPLWSPCQNGRRRALMVTRRLSVDLAHRHGHMTSQ